MRQLFFLPDKGWESTCMKARSNAPSCFFPGRARTWSRQPKLFYPIPQQRGNKIGAIHFEPDQSAFRFPVRLLLQEQRHAPTKSGEMRFALRHAPTVVSGAITSTRYSPNWTAKRFP